MLSSKQCDYMSTSNPAKTTSAAVVGRPWRLNRSCSSNILSVILSFLIALSLGFSVGSRFSQYGAGWARSAWLPVVHEEIKLPAPFGDWSRVLHYNRTFSSNLSPESDRAWASLFPANGGFVQHPDLSPQVSTPAVFHQLHCLDALRRGYYAALSLSQGQPIDGRSVGENSASHHHASPSHIRHCFDLLRQTLMCAADTNLEPVDVELGGVTGWGERRCRSFDAVVEWSTKHAATNEALHSLEDGPDGPDAHEMRGGA